MIDTDSLDDLLVVRRIRELCRKWWHLEIAFADSRGYVADHARGVIIPPQNPFCRAALASPEGFKRCNRSIEQATATVAASITSDDPDMRRGRIVSDCHLGFPVVMAPVAHLGQFFGTVFTGAFVIDAMAQSMTSRAVSAAAELRLPISDLGTSPDDEALARYGANKILECCCEVSFLRNSGLFA